MRKTNYLPGLVGGLRSSSIRKNLVGILGSMETLQPPVFQPHSPCYNGLLRYFPTVSSGTSDGRKQPSQQSVYGSHMKRGNKFFQFRKENGNKRGDRLFELRVFLNLIKTVTSE